ncbi:hypothetical protein DFH08DRAFT_957886 [Mycena albidolilacea]|uniref:Uncharacterized protein n=1 Tax=Mycena albidolilacea TaxID=1033008 RepID=A0AAD7A8U2_9AGAR|nr:hypothetical protein DFH08DRAFT_957886 [Mycena albidolilacea]
MQRVYDEIALVSVRNSLSTAHLRVRRNVPRRTPPNTIRMTVTAQYARQTNCHAPPFAVPPSHEAAMKFCGPDDHDLGRTAMIQGSAADLGGPRRTAEKAGAGAKWTYLSLPRARRTRPFRRVASWYCRAPSRAPRGVLFSLPFQLAITYPCCEPTSRVFHRPERNTHESTPAAIGAAFSHTGPFSIHGVEPVTRLSLSPRLHNSHHARALTLPHLRQQGGLGMHPDDLSQHRRPFSYRAAFSSPLLHTVDAVRAEAVTAARAVFATPWKPLHGRYSVRDPPLPRTTSRSCSTDTYCFSPPTPPSSSPRAPRPWLAVYHPRCLQHAHTVLHGTTITTSCLCNARPDRSPLLAPLLSPPHALSSSTTSRTLPVHARASAHLRHDTDHPRRAQPMRPPLPNARTALITYPPSPAPHRPPMEARSTMRSTTGMLSECGGRPPTP